MLGLRTQESEPFVRFFSLVQAEAEKLGKVFFLDCGEGRDIITEDFSGEDLSGWLVPKECLTEFEKKWLKFEVEEKWEKYYCFALWEYCNDLMIKFDKVF